VSESVKELEDRVLKEDPELFCKAKFWTIMGLYSFRIIDIAEMELDKLKAYVEALEDVYKKVKGNDAYSSILDVVLDNLISMGKTLIDAKEGRIEWYSNCLKRLIDGQAKKG